MTDPTTTAACTASWSQRYIDHYADDDGRCRRCGAVTDSTPATAAQIVQVDDEFLARLLRSLRRAGHCSGIPLSHGRSKQYGDIIRALEKRIVRERYP